MKRPNVAARNGRSRRAFLVALAGTGVAASHAAVQPAGSGIQHIDVGYLRWAEPYQTISRLDKPAPNNGLAGAKLAIDDDNTTGHFMGQDFSLTDVKLHPGDDAVAALGKLAAKNIRLVLTDMPGDVVVKLADAGRAAQQTIFNVGSPDDALRGADCRANMIHVAPSRAMLADGLAQYLAWKRWSRWVLVAGSHPGDIALADAYRRSAKRFGARIVHDLTYKDPGGSRETDSGLIQIQQQMPVFTQNLPNYDVLVAADEHEVFAGYLPYRTWDARPVCGSAGLRPTSWDASTEFWGGAQIQNRFDALFKRTMTALDMQAWTACRMIGEAASRTHSADPAVIMAYMRSPKFAVAAYKGQGLTLRDWDWQLRQPILLSDGRNTVSASPQPGFLHQVTTLDTLGIDRPETTCTLN